MVSRHASTFFVLLACLALALQASATSDAEESRAHVLTRMNWWSGSPLSSERPRVPDSEKYLIFDHDSGGLNNIRIGWEMAAVAASESNRTLVWPPQQVLYLLNAEPSGIEYFMNMKAYLSGVNAISVSDLIRRRVAAGRSIPQSLDKWSLLQEGPSKDTAFPRADWVKYREKEFHAVGHTDLEVCDMKSYRVSHDVIYQDPDSGSRIFTCGNWPNVGEPRFADGFPNAWMTPNWAFALLKRHFMWHPDAFDIASHVVADLGLFNYVSLHARYGDFQWKENRTVEDTLLKNGWLSSPSNASSFLQVADDIRYSDAQKSLPPSVQLEGLETIGAVGAVPSFLQTGSGSGLLRREVQSESQSASVRGQHAVGVVRRWLQHVDGGKERSVYVATDQTSESYLVPFEKAGIRTVRWNDLMNQAKIGKGPLAEVVKRYTPQRLSNLAGVVESLICVYGKVFIGSEKSTFSGNIERMRLYTSAPTHATANIRYDGPDRTSKGERLFHPDAIDPTIEHAIAEKLEAWDAGAAEVSEIGELPRPQALYPF